jgi:hypothetical protein
MVAVLLHGTIAAQEQPQSSRQTVAKMQQVLRKAYERDKAVSVTLNKKIENRLRFTGKVSDISDAGFVVTEKTRTSTKLVYEDVQEIHQRGFSKVTEIAIGVGILAAVVLVIFAAMYPKT